MTIPISESSSSPTKISAQGKDSKSTQDKVVESVAIPKVSDLSTDASNKTILAKKVDREIELQKKEKDVLPNVEYLKYIANKYKSDTDTQYYKNNSIELEKAEAELALIQKELETNLDLSSPSDQFIKKSVAMIVSNKKSEDAGKDKLLRQAINIGLKGYQSKESEAAQTEISGLKTRFHGHERLKYATALLIECMKSDSSDLGLETDKDKQDLFRIFKHRQNFSKYLELYEPLFGNSSVDFKSSYYSSEVDKIRKVIIENIEDLDNPNSPNVVLLDDGTTTFVMPGGWDQHYISYEIRKNPDGTYEFIIHNRGSGSSDENFHGDLNIENNGKTYARTRVPVRITKKDLTNTLFLNFLIKSTTSTCTTTNELNTRQEVYSRLKTYLDPRKNVIISEEEKLAQKLEYIIKDESNNFTPDQIADLKKLQFQLIKLDPNFHSKQLFGTCTESNQTTPEKEMAPKWVHRSLKLHTITGLTNEIFTEYLSDYTKDLKTKDLRAALNELLTKMNSDGKLYQVTKGLIDSYDDVQSKQLNKKEILVKIQSLPEFIAFSVFGGGKDHTLDKTKEFDEVMKHLEHEFRMLDLDKAKIVHIHSIKRAAILKEKVAKPPKHMSKEAIMAGIRDKFKEIMDFNDDKTILSASSKDQAEAAKSPNFKAELSFIEKFSENIKNYDSQFCDGMMKMSGMESLKKRCLKNIEIIGKEKPSEYEEHIRLFNEQIKVLDREMSYIKGTFQSAYIEMINNNEETMLSETPKHATELSNSYYLPIELSFVGNYFDELKNTDKHFFDTQLKMYGMEHLKNRCLKNIEILSKEKSTENEDYIVLFQEQIEAIDKVMSQLETSSE
ncbi:MAG: hypothetical protein H0W88_00155 [Parachlamydiaceae bacterium]|nr:hypothetical protein [Parachlamydiaceae bacterium]